MSAKTFIVLTIAIVLSALFGYACGIAEHNSASITVVVSISTENELRQTAECLANMRVTQKKFIAVPDISYSEHIDGPFSYNFYTAFNTAMVTLYPADRSEALHVTFFRRSENVFEVSFERGK